MTKIIIYKNSKEIRKRINEVVSNSRKKNSEEGTGEADTLGEKERGLMRRK